jgi:hypothetical protein
MRNHVAGDRIEIETVIITVFPRRSVIDKVTHDPSSTTCCLEQRRSRARLIAVVQVISTVERTDGQVFAPFSEDCSRLENGISTTAAPPPGAGGNASLIATGCLNQFKLGIYRINKRIRERRFPLVDEERGVVVASGFFDHDNEVDVYKLTNGRDMKTALKWPEQHLAARGLSREEWRDPEDRGGLHVCSPTSCTTGHGPRQQEPANDPRAGISAALASGP